MQPFHSGDMSSATFSSDIMEVPPSESDWLFFMDPKISSMARDILGPRLRLAAF